MNRKKGKSSAKVRSASQEEGKQKWKEHFKNLLRNPLKSLINLSKIISGQEDIKLGQFTAEEFLRIFEKNIKEEKIKATTKFNDILFQLCTVVYKNTTEKWTGDCILPFQKKGDHGVTKN